ncbi:MAG: PLP-dependent aminotransferase family protein, partial [Thiothrix sp.]|nr:PLP-dependent aminotransferase family protein [Thiothrix sp.]
PTLSQLALADYLLQGGHERYLRQVQRRYFTQVERFSFTIRKHFPASTRISQPVGGFVLWVELEPAIDTLRLTHRMLQHRVSIAPGRLFSANQKYPHCLRLNCAQPWSETLERALIQLGKEIGA